MRLIVYNLLFFVLVNTTILPTGTLATCFVFRQVVVKSDHYGNNKTGRNVASLSYKCI